LSACQRGEPVTVITERQVLTMLDPADCVYVDESGTNCHFRQCLFSQIRKNPAVG
jgi:hypothetical protein